MAFDPHLIPALHVDGTLRRLAGEERTPFAVVTPFAADVEVAVDAPLDHDALLALVDRHAGAPGAARAVRVDGVMDVHARSVPRQDPPYRPLADVVADHGAPAGRRAARRAGRRRRAGPRRARGLTGPILRASLSRWRAARPA
jgi:Alpha-acetolactate decarboxylase